MLLVRLLACLIAALITASSIALSQQIGRRMTAFNPYNPAWTPASSAALIGFIDFQNNSKITVDGSNNIGQIVDTTNGAVFSQATTANKPLLVASGHNSTQVARFNGTSSRLTYTTNALYPLSGAFSWWVIGYQNYADSSASNGDFVTFGNNSAGQFYKTTRGQTSSLSSARCVGGNGTVTTTNSISTTNYVFDGRFGMRCVSTGTTLYSTAWNSANGGQGVAASTVSIGSISNSNVVIGASGVGTGNFCNCDISAIVVFGSGLTTNDNIQMGYWTQVRL